MSELNNNLELTSKDMQEIAVIMPALNEEKNIREIISGIKIFFPLIDVIVINDGSTDNTKKIAEENGAIVLSHINKMGYGISLQTGYKYVIENEKYKYIVQLDSDGQHDYKDIPKLITPLIEKKADLVIGSRFIAKDNHYKMPLMRKLGVYFFRLIMYIFTQKKIKDITSGMQAFNRKILKHYISDDFPCYYPDANMLILILKSGFTILEVPTIMKENANGKSMHKGLSNQIYYVITMCLSILVILCKGVKKQNAV